MNDRELPPDLAALEHRLTDRPRIDPPASLGLRIDHACRRALAPRPAVGWRFLAGAAAALLLGINLSMSVAANTEWRLQPSIGRAELTATADRLRELAPELSEVESRRQALLVRAGAGLAPIVPLSPNLRHRGE